ncbi:helix-turn-helix domain-containing protein [Shimia sp.]|uniref:helix-turn-helix domain-containing protein n=1 Tax=Shimia sp. TaxID=1954381 RepID=UPI003568C20B
MDVSELFWYISNMDTIKNFNLYGEFRDFPDVVHCETIEVRSQANNWEFRPHRHARLHQFLLLESGGGEAILEDRRHRLEAGMLINVPVGVVHGFAFAPETTGWVVTLAAELLVQGLLDGEGLHPYLKMPKLFNYDNEIKGSVRAIFAEHGNRSFARAHILRAHSGVLIGLVARRIAEQAPAGGQSRGNLLHRFETLLEKHAADHLGVAQYAERLGVTPTHLSRVMRRATGRSALAAIEQHMIREARRNLAFTNLSVSEIAYQLGYVDPAYFSRVFKRATGLSPRAFRHSLEG